MKKHCSMCEAYKAKMFKSDAKIVKQQARIKALEAQLSQLRSQQQDESETPEKQEVSKTDGLDFFKDYTGLQLQRMKFK
jgi:hypothetical protein